MVSFSELIGKFKQILLQQLHKVRMIHKPLHTILNKLHHSNNEKVYPLNWLKLWRQDSQQQHFVSY